MAPSLSFNFCPFFNLLSHLIDLFNVSLYISDCLSITVDISSFYLDIGLAFLQKSPPFLDNISLYQMAYARAPKSSFSKIYFYTFPFRHTHDSRQHSRKSVSRPSSFFPPFGVARVYQNVLLVRIKMSEI